MKYKIKIIVFIICASLAVAFVVVPAVQINMQNKKYNEKVKNETLKKKKDKIEQTINNNNTSKGDEDTYRSKELNDKYEKGLDAFNKKQFYEAINIENEVVAQDDKFYEAHNVLGLSYCYLKKYNESITEIDKALSIKSDYASAMLSKALCYETFAHYDEAIAWYNMVLAKEDNAFCYYGIAGCYASKGNSKEAISNLKTAIEKDPTLKDRVKNDLEFASIKNSKEYTDLIK